ncbi:MAG TPA: NAD(P)/FAD-dependent oxidoreductase [Solirubrobacterales bacterium]|nr:NAD(P)/FAD-dependent oxidoreductase [Solirubrobacterales bacterium]
MDATAAERPVEHLDVLIVGAGISGISAACHLRDRAPEKSFTILEARDAIGGTWDLFRYPGIRSDSDMYTLGFSFRPWEQPEAIAPGPKILDYLEATVADHDLTGEIRFHHRVVRAEWSSEDALWHVEAERTDDAEAETLLFTCRWLCGCTGYYRYDEGYTPEFPGIDGFGGEVVHPQHWPEDLDYAGKRVVVIGSGATAVTLIPTLSEQAASVTMLQRSPTYIISLPGEDPLAIALRRRLPSRVAYALTRAKNVALQMLSYRFSRRFPKLTRRLLRRGVVDSLPAGFDVDTHFEPTYDPWDQRLCLDPDGDLFKAISAGRAEIVTDRIETFTAEGIRLESGRELDADIVVTATGLNLLFFGDIELSVDGERIDPADRVAYKAMMLSGVPNLSFSVGYTNASWTLKCDLVSKYVCRLLEHMDAHGYAYCVPRVPGPGIELSPVIDLEAGYVLRSLHKLPRQGSRAPWRLRQNYPYDVAHLRWGSIDEGMEFHRAPAPSPREVPAVLSG